MAWDLFSFSFSRLLILFYFILTFLLFSENILTFLLPDPLYVLKIIYALLKSWKQDLVLIDLEAWITRNRNSMKQELRRRFDHFDELSLLVPWVFQVLPQKLKFRRVFPEILAIFENKFCRVSMFFMFFATLLVTWSNSIRVTGIRRLFLGHRFSPWTCFGVQLQGNVFGVCELWTNFCKSSHFSILNFHKWWK